MEILKTGNPTLVQKSKKVNKINKRLIDQIKEMENALLATRDPIGVGLAAPQVGIPLRLFLAKPSEKSPIFVFINPQIVASSATSAYWITCCKQSIFHFLNLIN